jgi:hypothetical protein
MFQELASVLASPRAAGAPKRSFRAEQFYEMNAAPECTPAVLVFPRVAGTETSTLRPMPRHEALLELLPNVLLTEPVASQAHVDALATLVRQCACYRLETGRDLDATAALLAELIA